MKNEQKCIIGMIGLDVMGLSLAKNIINHGFRTALYSVPTRERERFTNKERNYQIFNSLEEFIYCLESPRKI